jgi:hypothetical protein
MLISRLAGTTSQTVYVKIVDVFGAPLTGLVFDSAGLTAYYVRTRSAPVQITLVTLAATTTAFTSGGFKEVDSTNMKGVYRLDVPDAAIASGADMSVVSLRGATNMDQADLVIELTATNNQSATAFMTSVGSVTGSVGSVTGAVGSVTGNVGGSVASVTGNVGGNVTGSVGSVVGAVGSVTGNVGGSVASVTGAVGSVTGNVGGNVTGTVGSVVGGVGGSVAGNVNGSVASVLGDLGGDVIGGMFGDVAGSVASVAGNVAGNVVGSVGSVLGNIAGSVASVTGAVGSVTGNVGGNVTGTVASVVGNVGGNVVGSVASVTGNLGGNVNGNVVGSVDSVVDPVNANLVTWLGIAPLALFSQKVVAHASSIDGAQIDTIAGIVWEYPDRTLTSGDNIVLAKDIGVTGFNDLDGSATAAAVWDALRASHTVSNSFGDGVQLSAATHAQIVTDAGVGAQAALNADSTLTALDGMMVADGPDFQWTANALELAPTGGGGGGVTSVLIESSETEIDNG